MQQIATIPTLVAAVHTGGNISASALIRLIRDLDGLNLEKKTQTVYRARVFVKDLSNAELRHSHQLISLYLTQL